eukprot:3940919-Rhodomonas_salina.5
MSKSYGTIHAYPGVSIPNASANPASVAISASKAARTTIRAPLSNTRRTAASISALLRNE